ncbi:claudin-8-like [Polyodon spathula]|uniref:claudin-8-like n=1 Tax=Polyodon spathula TaxID=7913 RepID=UPI001B7EB62C|nr:claudin-8-like [Polyodon spathula]
MNKGPIQIVALVLGIIGLVGACAVTGMPQWKVSAFIQENIIVFENRWEGLWMNCIRQANFRMQCKVYDSLLALPPDLQAGRGLMCASVALAFVGLLISLIGMKCTTFVDEGTQAKGFILISAGILLVISGICIIIPVSWTANTIIKDFYNPLLLTAQKRELGEALYIGWTVSGFLFASGIIMICISVPREERTTRLTASSKMSTYHPPTLQRQASVVYSKSQYV